MKLGICYNLFDGYELLGHVLENSSKYTDYCCLVVQEVSNLGRSIDISDLKSEINKCSKFIDEVFYYTPNLRIEPCQNELIKRNIGLKKCRTARCTHFVTADVDEFYDPKQVEFAKKEIAIGGYEGSACKMVEYYHDTNHCFSFNEEYLVPFIYKLDNRNLVYATPFHRLNVDPTRRRECSSIRLFSRDELQMHHLTYVRRRIYDKLANSSNRMHKNERNLRIVEEYYNNWNESKKAMANGNPPELYDLEQVSFDFLPKIGHGDL